MASPNKETYAGVESKKDIPKEKPGLMTPDVTMVVMTWVSFFILSVVLYKFAWKPILTALEDRERLIAKSIDDAEKTSAIYAEIEQAKAKMIDDAQKEAGKIIEEARQRSLAAASSVQEKAKAQAEETMNKAFKRIETERDDAIKALKETQADISIQLASNLVRRNLDDDTNRKLVDDLIKEIV